jgi:hypothetical protein
MYLGEPPKRPVPMCWRHTWRPAGHFREEYSFRSRYLFPSRITPNGIMPPEAVNGIADTVSDICEEKVDMGLLRDIFGSQ